MKLTVGAVIGTLQIPIYLPTETLGLWVKTSNKSLFEIKPLIIQKMPKQKPSASRLF